MEIAVSLGSGSSYSDNKLLQPSKLLEQEEQWSWHVRLANPKFRLEAKSSRRQLHSALGKLTSQARVNKIVLALTHEATTLIKAMVVNVSARIDHIRSAAPQLTGAHRWYALARYIADKILAFAPNTVIPSAAATG